MAFRVVGPDASRVFANEPGGHRWQRTPKNDKRGRVHTSSITVAVLQEPTEVQMYLDPRDIDFQTCRSSGSGGQSVNKTNSAVQLTHRPTGLQVRVENEKSQHQNKATALSLLRARLWEAKHEQVTNERSAERKRQVGTAMRGDKVRTYRVQDGIVTDHRTNQKARLDRILSGHLEDLR